MKILQSADGIKMEPELVESEVFWQLLICRESKLLDWKQEMESLAPDINCWQLLNL